MPHKLDPPDEKYVQAAEDCLRRLGNGRIEFRIEEGADRRAYSLQDAHTRWVTNASNGFIPPDLGGVPPSLIRGYFEWRVRSHGLFEPGRKEQRVWVMLLPSLIVGPQGSAMLAPAGAASENAESGALEALPALEAEAEDGETEDENESGWPKTRMGRIPQEDGSIEVACPACHSSNVGTVERLAGLALVSCLDVNGTINYEGGTKVWYDDSKTVRDATGVPLFGCDSCGHTWSELDAEAEPKANPDERCYYTVCLWRGAEALLHGPHKTEDERNDDLAERWHAEGGVEGGHTFFGLNLRIDESGHPVAEVAEFSNAMLERMAEGGK